MSHGPTRKTVATKAPKLTPEGSAPLESVDLEGNRRTVDVPNQEIFLHLLDQFERLNATMLRIEEHLAQLSSNDLRQAISMRGFTNSTETRHGN